MKKEYIILNEIKITARNKREDQLARVISFQVNDILEDLVEGDLLGQRLCKDMWTHWRIRQIAGELDACFFMDMVKSSTSDAAIWELINNEYWARMGWNA